MKQEDSEKRLIEKQERYIRVLEGQLDVCREQIKAQELLIEKQNQALALFAGALSKEGEIRERDLREGRPHE